MADRQGETSIVYPIQMFKIMTLMYWGSEELDANLPFATLFVITSDGLDQDCSMSIIDTLQITHPYNKPLK